MRFLRKVTLSPDEVMQDDVEPLRAVGLSDRAIVEALHVCVVFNLIDRVADALGFNVPSNEVFAKSAKVLLKRGYR